MALAKTNVDSESQVRSMITYNDQLGSGSGLESGVSLNDDMNAVFSQLNRIINSAVSGNDWFAPLDAPVTFEGGTVRGVNANNQDLHDLQRKRILKRVSRVGTDVGVSTAAAGTLTGTANFANTETVTLDVKTYTFQTALTNVDGNVQIGVDLATSLSNLQAAINLGAGSGTAYAAATTLHPTVYASAITATTLVATAKTQGSAGNSIASTETGANASWDAATLGTTTSGGSTTAVIVLSTSQLPTSSTTAAIGTVTTLGVVAATATSFGTADTNEVVGSNPLQPKNLWVLVDASTGEPLARTGGVADGKQVYGLGQVQSSTDGSTITGTDPNGLQISLVVRDSGGTDLELISAGDVPATATIDYAWVVRDAFEDCPEEAWLGDGFTDGAAVVDTRQSVYDNQGATAFTTTSSATLDLGTGFFWEIGDVASAALVTVTEGSGGGTTAMAIGVGVDTYNNNAVDVNFNNGITADNGSNAINVGVTADQIDFTGNGTVTASSSSTVTVTAASANATLSTTGSGNVVLSSAGNVTVDGAVLSLDGTDTTNLTMTASDAGTKTLSVSATNGGAGVADVTVSADGRIDLQATAGAVTIDSSGSSIGIGTDANTGAINIGTGASARTITMGNATGITAVDFDSGTGAFSFDSTTADTAALLDLATTGTGGDAIGFFVGSSSPDGRVTGSLGSLFADGTNAALWINIDGSTDWAQFDVGAVGGTLQAAYEAGNTIVTDTTNGDFDVSGTEAFSLDGGAASNVTVTGASADLTLSTGNTTVAGDVLVTAGTSSTATTVGGGVTVTAGGGATTGAGGPVGITGGAGGATDGSLGGGVTISGGVSTATNGTGGAVLIDGGAESGTGAEGAISIGSLQAGAMLIGVNGGGTRIADSMALGSTGTMSMTSDGVMSQNANASLDVNVTGAYTLDATTTVSIDSADDTNLTMAASDAGTKTMTIAATNAGAGVADVLISADGEVDVTSTGLMDLNAGANLDVDVTGTFDMLSSGAFSIDGTGASNVTATSGNLTVATVTSGGLIVSAADAVAISAGDEAAAAGNNISVTAGSATAGTGAGGAVISTAGDGFTTGFGGNNTVTAGVGGATGDGGSTTVTAGAGGATSGFGGELTLASGTAGPAGGGGTTFLTSGDGGSTSGNGGGMNINAGSADGGGSGGTLNLSAGDSVGAFGGQDATMNAGSAGTTGAGGYANLNAGAGGSSSGDGGFVVISSGTGLGSGVGGEIQLVAAEGTTDNGFSNFTGSFDMADTDEFWRLTPSGAATNGPNSGGSVFVSMFAGNRDPNTIISATPGSLYMRGNSTTSAVYLNDTSGTAAGTDWVRIATLDDIAASNDLSEVVNNQLTAGVFTQNAGQLEWGVPDGGSVRFGDSSNVDILSVAAAALGDSVVVTMAETAAGATFAVTDGTNNLLRVIGSTGGDSVVIENIATFTADATGAISFGAAAASDFTVASAALTLETTGAFDASLIGGGAVAIESGTTDIGLTATTSVDIMGGTEVTITSGGTSDVDILAARDLDMGYECLIGSVGASASGHERWDSRHHYFGEVAANPNYLTLNAQNTGTSVTGGTVVVTDANTYSPGNTVSATTSTTFTVDTGAVPGIAVGAFLLVTSASVECVNGLYQVLSRVDGTITIDTTPDEPFCKTSIGFTGSVTATLFNADVCVLRCSATGAWEVADGTAGPLSYTELGTTAGSTLQAAYVAGSDILVSSANTSLNFSGTVNDATNVLELASGNHTASTGGSVLTVTDDASSTGIMVGLTSAGSGTGLDVLQTGSGAPIVARTASQTLFTVTGTGGVSATPLAAQNFTASMLTTGNFDVDVVTGDVTFDASGAGADYIVDGFTTVNQSADSATATAATVALSANNTSSGNGVFTIHASATGAGTATVGITSDDTIDISVDAVANTVNVGTGAAAKAVTLGSSNTTSSTTIDGGSGGVDVNSTGSVTATADTTITLTTSDIADASASDISLNAGSSSTAATDGASIRLLPGDGGTTGAHGTVDIDGAFDNDEAFLTLTGSGGSGNSDLFAGATAPTHTAVAGSLFLFNDGTNAATGGRVYVQVDADGGGDDGSNWDQLATTATSVSRKFFQTTMTSSVAAGSSITSSDISGTLPTKPAAGFSFDIDAEIYLNGILLMNGSGNEVTSGTGDEIALESGGPAPTFRIGDVITVIYHTNSTAG